MVFLGIFFHLVLYISYIAGGRTAAEIVSWLLKKSGPATVELKTVEEATAFASEEIVLVGYFSNSEDALAKVSYFVINHVY